MNKLFQKICCQTAAGISLIEVIIAMAIFAMVAAAIISMSTGGFNALSQGGDQAVAEGLAKEGLEAVKSIREGAWNELAYSQSGVNNSSTQWALNGEGTTETIGRFTRTISFVSVCRDGLNEITDCPGNYTDINTKQVVVNVSWLTGLGKTNSISQSAYLTNWDSQDWSQTDWQGGPGQTVWSDATRFDDADPAVNYATPGEVKLYTDITGQCEGKTWHFTTPNDYVYDSDFIRVEDSMAQLRPFGEIIIGIEDSPIDTLEFDTGNGQDPDIIHIANDIYAIAYRGVNNDGFVRTVQIDNDGNITNYYIDSLEFDSSDCYTPDITHVADNVYAIAYRGRQSDGYIVTLEINSNGDIANSLISSWEYSTMDAYEPQIINISGNVYAIVYRHILSGGAVITFTINDNGTFGGAIDWWLYSFLNHYDPDIIRIVGNIYAIAYRSWSNDGYLATLQINDDGNIGGFIETYEYDNSQAYEPDMTHVTDNVIAIAYRGSNDDGYLKTVRIENNGNIITPFLDGLEFDTNDGYDPQVVYLEGTLYGVAYHDSNNGKVTVMDIQDNGQIADSVMDTFTVEAAIGGSHMSMVHVSGYVYAIAYDGPNNDGYVTTLEMATTGQYPDEGPNIYPVDSYQPQVVDQWTKIEEVAFKDGGEIYYQISDNNGATWQYWNGLNWVVATTGQYNTAEEINEHLWSWQPQGNSFKFNAFLVGDGTQNVRLDAVIINCSNLQMEAGTVTTDENWIRVNLDNVYSSPVIIALPKEVSNASRARPFSIRLNNVGSSFFDIRLQSPDNRNLYDEEIDYFVIEEGVWEMDGYNIEAHRYDTDTIGYDGNWAYDLVSYQYGFTSPPAILHQVMTSNDSNWTSSYVSNAATRTTPPGLTNFRLALNGAEAKTIHGKETIGWIAVDPGAVGVFAETAFETYRTPTSVRGHDNGCYYFTYNNIYDTAPIVLAAQQTMVDTDGSWSMECFKDQTWLGLHSEEDNSLDWERSHDAEMHAFLAFAGPFSYSSVGDAQGISDSGSLYSSALDTIDSRAMQTVSWSESIPAECPLCEVTMQIRSADTQEGLSTAEWSGPAGVADSFTNYQGSLANILHNGDRWLQYRINLVGDGDYTPVVRDININYK